MLEAAIKAKDFGYNQFLFLCDSRSVQVTIRRCTPSWQERRLLADGSHLAQNVLP